MLIKGGVTLITRGFGQTVTLEPYLFAEVKTNAVYHNLSEATLLKFGKSALN